MLLINVVLIIFGQCILSLGNDLAFIKRVRIPSASVNKAARWCFGNSSLNWYRFNNHSVYQATLSGCAPVSTRRAATASRNQPCRAANYASEPCTPTSRSSVTPRSLIRARLLLSSVASDRAISNPCVQCANVLVGFSSLSKTSPSCIKLTQSERRAVTLSGSKRTNLTSILKLCLNAPVAVLKRS